MNQTIDEVQEYFEIPIREEEEQFLFEALSSTPSNSKTQSSLVEKTPINKTMRKRARSEPSEEMQLAINQLDKISQAASSDAQEYDYWAKSLAQKLRSMPHIDALSMQNKIDNIMFEWQLNFAQNSRE